MLGNPGPGRWHPTCKVAGMSETKLTVALLVGSTCAMLAAAGLPGIPGGFGAAAVALFRLVAGVL